MSDNTNTGANANRDALLAAVKEDVLGRLEITRRGGRETLEAFRDIGRLLEEAKEALAGTGKGAFGKWAEDTFGFSKEWRARLMRLNAEWKGVVAAMAHFTKLGRVLGRKEYSVDGALALVAEWIAADPYTARELGFGDRVDAAEKKAEEKRQREAGEGDGEGGEGSGKKESAADRLRRELAEALARIAELEAELAKAKKGGPKGDGPKGGGAKAGEAPKGDGPAPDGAKVDAKAKAKARKVAEMALRGATVGERNAGRAALARIAEGAGVSLDDLLTIIGADLNAHREAWRRDREETEAAREAA